MKKSVAGSGFTLIEVLVGIAVIGVIGFMTADILARSFRTSDKTQLMSNVKQNGQTALNILEQTIRTSGKILCTGNLRGGSDDTIALERSGEYIRFSFHPETGTSNGYITQELLSVSDFNTNLPDYCANESLTGKFSVSKNLTLTDINTVSGVSVGQGSFQKLAGGNGYKDAVEIRFRVKPAVLAGSTVEKQLDPVEFQATVGLR